MVESGFADLAWPEDERARHADENRVGWGVELDELRAYAASDDARRTRIACGRRSAIRCACGVLDLLLERGDATASALAAALPITRQGVAKHLAVLERSGLVVVATGRARGPLRGPRGSPGSGQAADGQVAARWDERLVAIKRIAEGV